MDRSKVYLSIILAVIASATWAITKSEATWLAVAASQIPLQLGFSNDLLGHDGWNLLHHLGGMGPWIQKVDNVVDGGLEVPEGCIVDQVHMISRHAERYPTMKGGIRMLELYHRLTAIQDDLQGDLSFVKNWSFFMSDPATYLESLVPIGPYAGSLGSFTTGVKLRTRYDHLLQQAIAQDQMKLWASDCHRVKETARYFASGFFGINWDRSNLHIVPETSDLGGNTLTPGRTCKNWADNVDAHGRESGYLLLGMWQSVYLPPIVARLEKQNPGINFTTHEVYVMQETCGFETIAKGSSPWCDVFTHEEWEQFEYARDLSHFYKTGPGNKYGAAMGFPFLNATTDLLKQGPDAGPLFFSFVHDGDIVPFLTALNLFSSPPLPTSSLLANRTWHTSSLVPMGGRVVLERLACARPKTCWALNEMYPHMIYCDTPTFDHYVRIVVNDGVVAVPDCQDGPGASCDLQAFIKRVEVRGDEIGRFADVCGLEDGAAEGIGFLHQ